MALSVDHMNWSSVGGASEAVLRLQSGMHSTPEHHYLVCGFKHSHTILCMAQEAGGCLSLPVIA